jgi:hypothetical protein|tara:strand:+ start:4317 stop:4823 length:507 start_codon:yes stop_codon:yes gene_type:complete
MYFAKFPTYEYDLQNNDKRTLITDILRRVNLRSNVQANTLVFDEYNVEDGETPDIVAAKYYGNSAYHWVIVTINNITTRYDWPLDQVALSQYVNDKYSNPDGTHHYELAQTSGDTTIKLEVASDTVGATIVTNYEYEQTLNDDKRRIRLLDRAYVAQFQEEFEQLIQR